MTDLLIRNLDPELEARLRDRATEKGRTVEDEAHRLLRALLAVPAGRRAGNDLGARIASRFAGIGLKPGEELQRPNWEDWQPPRFED